MSELDRYLDDFGRTLARASAAQRPAPAPPRRRRWMAAGGFATAVAGAVVAVLALPGAQERLDPVAEARAALAAPGGQIVHTVVVQTSRRQDAKGRFVPARTADTVRVEQWSAGSRWRLTSRASTFGPVELARDGDVQRTYDRKRNRLTIVRGMAGGRPLTSPGPQLFELGADPVVLVRRMLDAGKLRDAGVTTVGGREVRRLAGEDRYGPRRGGIVVRTEYHVDAATAAPIGFTITTRLPGDRRRNVLTATFKVYERLTLNAETAPLLRIDTKPDPTVVVQWLRPR